jgi:hypothetical protein
MERSLLEKAEQIKKEMEEKAQKNGSEAVFEVETVTIGWHTGEVQIRKEKPSGEVIIYPVSTN